MTSAATTAALEAIFDGTTDDQEWLDEVLRAVGRLVRASAGLAYAWGPRRAMALWATTGDGMAADSAAATLSDLPRRWFVRLHRAPRRLVRFDRKLAELPPDVRRRTKDLIDSWSRDSQGHVYALVPCATEHQGLCLVLGLGAGTMPGSRARQTLASIADHVATAFALRRAASSARGDARRVPDEGSIWRELFHGRWAILRAERTPTTNGLLLARLPRNVAHDPRSITARERQVLALTLEGRSNKWIAWKLGIATATVASHMQRMTSKLGVRSRSELLAFFGAASPITQ